ncbi:TrkH family potassium uptake protein [Rheinheimera sp. 4Y26]|uniref:TrkH family potassium uptake protein n=1 Tax=Rheinheimera sp. 4Y26 TaxID=2977811 RepID=UPI0021B0E234|nr:TrkH family potassium uptake protein [Rheinheimera sp. 4Y26]MCT6698181.1 TrkH family potassium uptake protein [Rheinheimera sp. 4Y26]
MRSATSRFLFYRVIGYLLVMLAGAMLITTAVAVYYDEKSFWSYLVSAFITASSGYFLVYKGRHDFTLVKRHLFLLTTLCWLSICLFSTLPVVLVLPNISYVDAAFETVSAITTTGATVLTGLDSMPKGLLFWRAILQWIGGVGIIVMAIAILPALKIGGMKLFKTENSDISEKILPRSSSLSMYIGVVYLILSASCMLLFYLGGMSGFDAITHGMTTVATGGFANYDASFGHFNDKPHLLWISGVFMLLSALPLVLLVGTIRGHKWILFKDPQVRAFFAITAFCVLLLTWYQHEHNARPWLDGLTHSFFNVVSVITTCGYASENYSAWGGLAVILFFYITFSGACSGSTSGGLKIFRTQLAGLLLIKQFKLLVHPNAVWVQKYGSKPVNDQLLGSVLAFCFVYFASIGALALGLSMFELDFVTALTGAATAISNVGPGLGPVIGPDGNFSSLPDGAKWLISFGMIIGRLEILTVLLLFTPMYWRY